MNFERVERGGGYENRFQRRQTLTRLLHSIMVLNGLLSIFSGKGFKCP